MSRADLIWTTLEQWRLEGQRLDPRGSIETGPASRSNGGTVGKSETAWAGRRKGAGRSVTMRGKGRLFELLWPKQQGKRKA